MRSSTSLIIFLGTFSCSLSHLARSNYNRGWEKFLDDEPTSFHNIPLTWEQEAALPPGWLVPTSRTAPVRNGSEQRRGGTASTWTAGGNSTRSPSPSPARFSTAAG